MCADASFDRELLRRWRWLLGTCNSDLQMNKEIDGAEGKPQHSWALGRLAMFMAISGMRMNEQGNSLTAHVIVPRCWWLSSQPLGREILSSQ